MSATLQPTRYSLFDIEAGWLPLLEARAEAEEITDQAERQQAIEDADVALAEHAEQELAKVDSYIGICKFLQFAVDAADQEQRRQMQRKAVAKRMLDQIKATALNSMEISGRQRLDGSRGYLKVAKNGGVQPLVVDRPELLPDDCCRMEGWISAKLWDLISDFIPPYADHTDHCFKRVPDNAAIRAKLLEPCPACLGAATSEEDCPTCAGTGKNAVAGAYLEERGRRLEIR